MHVYLEAKSQQQTRRNQQFLGQGQLLVAADSETLFDLC
jgi:hypothetical protein